MKTNQYIAWLAVCATASSLQAQSLDNVPTDPANFTLIGPPSWTYSDPVLGNVTATYITDNDTSSNSYRNPNPNSEPGFVREGYFAYRNNPNGVTGITGSEQLVFSWDNPVNSLEVAIGDFDESGLPTLNFTGDVTGVALGDIGSQPEAEGYTYSTTSSSLSLVSRGPGNNTLQNARIYNSIDVVLTGTAMTTFTLAGQSTNINAIEIGGPNAVAIPEPSTALLGALAGLGLLARRRR